MHWKIDAIIDGLDGFDIGWETVLKKTLSVEGALEEIRGSAFAREMAHG